MKELLQIFQYIQKYHSDGLESLEIFLGFLLFSKERALAHLSLKESNAGIDTQLEAFLEKYALEILKIHPKLNRKKILKSMLELEVSPREMELFLQTIALQKTILKLYDYAIPAEVNKLIIKILEIGFGERVYNPCCGFSNWLLGVENRNFEYYAEDIHPKSIQIAKMLAVFMGIKKYHFGVADVLKDSCFKELEFNKAFCFLPFEVSSGYISFEGMADFGKNTSEIPFLNHALKVLKNKGVFILKTALLYKANGEKLRRYLLEQKLLQALIDLPKNIFPLQTEEFSLLVLSKEQNQKVLFINAQNLFVKEGKYHHLTDVEMLYDLYLSKQDTKYSKLVEYSKMNLDNFKASYYMKEENNEDFLPLLECLECVYRGQRIEAKKDGVLVDCYNAGIKDFLEYGFSEEFNEFSPKSNQKRIEQLKIKPYDILLSMRGISPKVAIIGEKIGDKNILPNAGILVLRPKNKKIAQALYVYFLSKEGFLGLSKIYQENQERIGEREVSSLLIPKDFLEYQERFNKLLLEGEQIRKCQKSIKALLGF